MNGGKLLFYVVLLSLIASMGYTVTPNQLPSGVRPLGMGEAFVAVADDANAMAWNPAGLVQLRHRITNAMYTDLYGIGLKYSYLSSAVPFSDSYAIGIDWSYLRFDDDELSLRDNRFGLSYGFRLIRQLSLGTNIRYVSIDNVLDGQSLGSASNLSVGAALHFRPTSKLSFGVFGQNLGHVPLSPKSEIPIGSRCFRAGVAYRPINKAVLALDIDDRVHLGLEKWFGGTLALRGGVATDMGNFHLQDSDKTFREPMSFAMGGSIKYRAFRFDYAYLNSPTLPDTHRFGLMIFLVSPVGPEPLISIEYARLADVLASFYSLYKEQSIQVGELILSSSSTSNIPFTVSIFVPGYMDKPAIVAQDEIPAAESGKVSEKIAPLALPLNQKIRSLEEDVDVEAIITVTYRYKWERQTSDTKKIKLRAVGQAAYSERLEPIVAFIDPEDPVVQKFANTSTETAPEITEPVFMEICDVSENILKALQIFEALNSVGINYAEDPYTPFQSIYGRNTVAQSKREAPQKNPLQYIDGKGPFKRTLYPGEMLFGEKKVGDCDDLSILYASLLEALGIRTQLIDVESRVFVMFDSGLRKDNIRGLNLDEGNFIKDSGIFWVPAETAMFGSLFIEAWRKGLAAYVDAENQDVLRLVDVQGAWKAYLPMHPKIPSSPIPAIGKINEQILNNLKMLEEFIVK